MAALVGDEGMAGALAVRERVALVTDVVVRVDDVRLLGGEELAEGQRKFLLERVLVDFPGVVFALLCSGEERVIAAAEIGFEVSPGAMQSASCGAGLADVGHAGAMQFAFELGTEVGSLEAFGEEVALHGFVLEVLADVGETFLTVLERFDDVEKDTFSLFVAGGAFECIGHVEPFGADENFLRITELQNSCGTMDLRRGGVCRLCAILLRRQQAGEIAKIPLPRHRCPNCVCAAAHPCS